MEIRTDYGFVALLDVNRQSDKKICQRSVRKIDYILVFMYFIAVVNTFCFFGVKRQPDILFYQAHHILDFFFYLHQSDGSHRKQTFVDVSERKFFFFLRFIFNDETGESY